MEHTALPVPGYKSQSQDRVDEVAHNKMVEERVLRLLDRMATDEHVDKRWLAIGRTHVEQGFMAINRAIFRPDRVELPEDREPVVNEESQK